MVPISRIAVAAVAGCLVVGVAMSAAHAGPRSKDRTKLSRALNTDLALEARLAKGSGARIPVIVTAEPGRELVLDATLGRLRVKEARALLQAGARVAWLTPDEIAELGESGAASGISLDAAVHATQARARSRVSQRFPLKAPGSALRGTTQVPPTALGTGVGVAIVDSGLSPIAGLRERITAFYDFTTGVPVARTPLDPYGHGTHVAGIIGGVLGDGVAGVAPGVRFIGLRVLDNKGAGATSHVIAALDFAVQHRHALGIQIINLSLGRPITESAATDPLVRAVERAVRAGIVVVTSAGNMGTNPATGQVGYAGIYSPGNAPSAITVGAATGGETATRGDDRVAAFSSRGPTWYDGLSKPDLVAPGVGVVSAMAPFSTLASHNELKVKGKYGTYLKLSGTSMATPVVTGVVALILEASAAACPARACPPLTPAAVKALLQYTATPLVDNAGVEYDALTQGAGEVNAAGAIALAQNIDTRMPVGSAWLRTGFDPWTNAAGEQWEWSQAIIWNNRLVGGGVIERNHPAWANTVVWGTDDSIVWGTDLDTIVWGTNVVWDDTVVWGTTIVWGTGLFDLDTIVWGTLDLGTVVWGMSGDGPDAGR
ncbi:MAG: S8 family serine peptidase [Acidobacteriota bacterium]